MKQQQEAERLAREAKKKAEEEAAKREKQEKLEVERQKREQERLRKEEEKRHREEERLRKEEEKKRRVKEEKERAAEKERKRKEKEEKERIEKEKLQKAKFEKEEKERLEREKTQKAKAEKEEKDRSEKEKAQKLKAEKDEKERLKQEAATKKATANAIVDQKLPITAAPSKPVKQAEVPVTKSTKTPSPPPGITAPATTSIDDSSDRQQVLIDALVGSGRPNFIESNATPINTTPIRPPPHLQHPSFMPSHLDILQGSSSSSSLLNASPIDHPSPSTLSDNSPSMMGMFNNRVTSPLEPSSSSRRSITPIAPIGQPINGRRVSSVPLGNSSLHDTPSDPIIAASNAVKRPSVASPFDSAEPRSFFSSFLFGEPRNNIMPMNDYDTRFTQQPAFDRRFSSEPNLQPMQPNWTNGWNATSVLSDNVHGKLFGDALVNYSIYDIFF